MQKFIPFFYSRNEFKGDRSVPEGNKHSIIYRKPLQLRLGSYSTINRSHDKSFRDFLLEKESYLRAIIG